MDSLTPDIDRDDDPFSASSLDVVNNNNRRLASDASEFHTVPSINLDKISNDNKSLSSPNSDETAISKTCRQHQRQTFEEDDVASGEFLHLLLGEDWKDVQNSLLNATHEEEDNDSFALVPIYEPTNTNSRGENTQNSSDNEATTSGGGGSSSSCQSAILPPDLNLNPTPNKVPILSKGVRIENSGASLQSSCTAPILTINNNSNLSQVIATPHTSTTSNPTLKRTHSQISKDLPSNSNSVSSAPLQVFTPFSGCQSNLGVSHSAKQLKRVRVIPKPKTVTLEPTTNNQGPAPASNISSEMFKSMQAQLARLNSQVPSNVSLRALSPVSSSPIGLPSMSTTTPFKPLYIQVTRISILLPIKSIASLNSLNRRVGVDIKVKDALFERLTRIGGADYGTCIQRILNTLVTPDVRKGMDWMGSPEKMNFGTSLVKNISFDAIRFHFPQATDAQLNVLAQKWFREQN